MSKVTFEALDCGGGMVFESDYDVSCVRAEEGGREVK